MISEIESAYAAGFFDGEGCVCISGPRPSRGKYSLEVQIGQCDAAPLLWLNERWPGGIYYTPGRGNKSPFSKWYLSSKKALAFLYDIRPFLIVKAAQVDIAFEFGKLILPPGGFPKKRLTTELLEKREALKIRLSEAKKDYRP